MTTSRLTTSTPRISQRLGWPVVVEGVESADEAQWLKELGCEYGQGYYFAPALPGAEALTYIAKHYDVEAAS